MSTSLELSGWKDDLARDAPVLPRQRDALLAAYKIATEQRHISPDNNQAIEDFLTANTTGTGRAVVKIFLSRFRQMALSGAIPYSVYDPSQSLLSRASGAVTGVARGYVSLVDKAKWIAIAGLGIYLLFTVNKIIPRRRG